MGYAMPDEDLEDYEQYLPWAPITPDVKEAIGWLFALYEENCAGGMLHACVDDMNLPATERDRQYLETTIEHRTLDALLKLSEREQACAVAVLHRDYRPENTPSPLLAQWELPFDKEWSREARFAHSMAQATGWHGPSAWLFTLYNTLREEQVPGCVSVDPDVESNFVSAHDHSLDDVCKSCGTAYPCEALRLKAWTYRDLPGFKAEWKPLAVTTEAS